MALSLSISLLKTWFSPQPTRGQSSSRKTSYLQGPNSSKCSISFLLALWIDKCWWEPVPCFCAWRSIGSGSPERLTVAWQHGTSLTSFQTNIWVAVVPELCGAAVCFCSREAAVWQRQRSHIFSHRSPPPPPPPFFLLHLCYGFMSAAWASLGLTVVFCWIWHTHIYSLSHSLCVCSWSFGSSLRLKVLSRMKKNQCVVMGEV